MPFFLPVEYYDDRMQLTDNLSVLRGNHSLKAGFEYNEVASSQTFIGFANGRWSSAPPTASSTTPTTRTT